MTNEQIQALKARYAEPETPNCRICGAKMSIQLASAGSLVYGCDGRVEGDGYAFKEGRNFADKHYEQSCETVYNTGDADVIALLADREADKALIAELQEDVAKANARNDEKCALLSNQDEEIATLRQCVTELEESKTNLAILYDANLCDMLTGVEYMDPPDGGQVEPIEQVSRMVADYRQQIAEQAKRIAELEASLKAAEINETDARCHIAELEARTLTVKLPEPLMPAQHNSGELFMTPDNIEQGGYLNRDDVLRALRKACAAAGIALVVEE